MDTEATTSAPADTHPAPSSRGFYGCAIAMIVALVLIALAAAGLSDFEKGLDGDGQMEQPGPDGSSSQPLGAGMTARYEDGLWVTVSAARPEGDGVYRLTVTYENDTDGELHLGRTSLDRPLVVRGGAADEDGTSDYSTSWVNSEQSEDALAPVLPEGESRVVPVLVEPSRKGAPVTVEVTPPHSGYRETAYFELSVG
ncbi:hypothetical protein ACIG0A_22185 [Streptomyces californicus]|uniref:hypothetical protein n=1 Tax=Streptomyces californicus TaxID=67351 RepID=UPI0037D17A71